MARKKLDPSIELMSLCCKLGLSIRINHKSGEINLYEELGEYECAEQAINVLKKQYAEALDDRS